MEELEIVEENDDGEDTARNDDSKGVANAPPLGDRTNSQNQSQNFDAATILIGLQILPGVEQTRQVLITTGIKSAPPIVTSTSLDEIAQCPPIAQALEQLKQVLPKMAEVAATREIASSAAQQVTSAKTTKAKVPPPDLPTSNTVSQSSQLSLFT